MVDCVQFFCKCWGSIGCELVCEGSDDTVFGG